jgi:hypothetical protein
MPRGQYERASKRGPYKKENGTMIKRVVYLTKDQFERLKEDSSNAGISYAELLRNILDEFFFDKSFDTTNLL